MFKKIAHSSNLPSLGNKDLKSLQDLIHSEKSVLASLQKLSTDLSKSSDALKTWGLGEGEDLGDVLNHSASILSHVSNALSVFASHEQTVRELLKAIRSREEKLDEMRNKRKVVGSKSDAAEKKLSKMGSENKNLPTQTDLLNRLRDEIRQLDSEIMVEEARIGDFKRRTTKNFMTLKLGGLLEFAEKATIVGELGKLLLEEIPMISTVPGENRALYMGHEKTEKLEQEVSRCVNEVVFSAANALEAENGRYDYAANQSGDNSYSNDQADYPHSQPISPAGAQDPRWPSSPMGTTRTMPDYSSGVDTGARYNQPIIANPDPPEESYPAEAHNEHIPMPMHSQPGERHMPPTSEAAPSIDVSFSSEFNPYSGVSPPYPPPGPENPWNRGSQGPEANHPGPREGAHPQDQRTVRFDSPSQQQPPFSQPTLPEISHEDHSEAPTQLPEDSRPTFSIPRIPAPARDPFPASEESLNLAAAKEITREMDSLSRPVPQERAPSPLVPPTLPFATRSVSPGPPSPRGPIGGEDLIPPRIAIGQRSRSGSGASSSSPTTRMEFPTPPPSVRTISAAAFKRAPGRSPNSEGEVRKRTLPASPYPPHRLNSTGSLGPRDMAGPMADQGPSQQPPPSAYEGGQEESRNEIRQSMDVPPSYRSVDEHANY